MPSQVLCRSRYKSLAYLSNRPTTIAKILFFRGREFIHISAIFYNVTCSPFPCWKCFLIIFATDVQYITSHFSVPERKISCAYVASCEMIVDRPLHNVLFIFPILTKSSRRQILPKISNMEFFVSPCSTSQIVSCEQKDRQTDG
jgi:hypothetical protein